MLEAYAELFSLVDFYNMQALKIDDILRQFRLHMLKYKDSSLDELYIDLIPVFLIDLFCVIFEVRSDFVEERLAVVQLPDVGVEP